MTFSPPEDTVTDKQFGDNFMNTAYSHPLRLNFLYHCPENAVVSERFASDFGKESGRTQIRHQVAERGAAPQHAQRAEQLKRQRHALPVGHAPLVFAVFGHASSPSPSDGIAAPLDGGTGLSARSFLKPRTNR